MTILSHIGNITLLILVSILIVCSPTFNGYAHNTLGEPHFHDESTSRSISENASKGTAVGDPVSAHSVVRDRYVMSGSNDFTIDAETGQLKTNMLLDYNVQSTYTVTVTIQKARVIQKEPTLIIEYSDADSITVTITVTEGGDSPNQQPPSQGKTGSPFQADTLPSLTAAQQLEIVRAVQLDTVIFNEVFNGSTDTHDWLELRNITDTDVDLSGWRLVLTTSEKSLSFNLPEGTILSGGEVFLLLNTDPNAPDMPLAIPEEASYQYLVDKEFILPQADFTILLRSPDAWQDAMGNYFFGYEVPRTAPSLTADIAWAREKPSVIGTRDEAWGEAGVGTPGYHQELLGDVNRDGNINILDLVFVASQLGQSGETVADINGDGTVNIQDLVLVANGLGGAAAPSGQALTATQMREWLRLAKEEGTLSIQRSVAQPNFSYERGVQVLEQLLEMLIPKETALLANYPNPFNPETWIPYQLATASDVKITIYDARGAVVRHLDVGHRPVGLYQTRSQAAYWDGTNASGESVASGIYFYTLTAGEFSATRKMLILK